MLTRFFRIKHLAAYSLAIILLLLAAGCSKPAATATQAPSTAKSPEAQAAAKSPEVQKQMPDQMQKVKVAIIQQNIDYFPWYVADKKGIFKKYNLEVETTQVDGGVTALRGLQSGDFHFSNGFAEPYITGIAEGANIKIIGAILGESMTSVFVTQDIQKIEDMKGKIAAGFTPGNGLDLQIRWWLKQHGLEPDKDVRIISAGGNSARIETLKTGNAQLTALGTPFDQVAEKSGLKKMAFLRDELKNNNHSVIAASGKLLKEKPEVARAFIAASSEAIEFLKNESNRKEVIALGTEMLKLNEEEFLKSFNMAIPAYPENSKFKAEGIKWSIDVLKQSGALNKELTVGDVTDESYYAQPKK